MRTTLRKRILILAALGVLVGVGLPGQAAATKSEQSAVSEECAAQLAMATTEGEMASCVETDPNATEIAVNDPYCPRAGWLVTRFRACTTGDYVLTVRVVRTREVVGRMYYSIRDEVKTTGKDSRWTHDRQFTVKSWWGAVAGSLLHTYGTCTGDCRDIDADPLPMPIPGGAPRMQGVFETSVSASGAIGYGTTTWRHWFSNIGWIRDSNPLIDTVPYQMRCDNALGGLFRTIGCVFHQVRPIHTITPALPSYHKHIRESLRYAMPRLLHRLTDSFLQQQNGNRACPATFTRPRDFQCDEYPFRSTHEGAFTGNHPWGRTFPGCQIYPQLKYRVDKLGWNSCMIPEGENWQGGQDLSKFYTDNRVLEGEIFEVAAN